MKIYPEYEDWACGQLDRDAGPEVWFNMPINEACRRAETICAIADDYADQGYEGYEDLYSYRAYDHLKEMVKVMAEKYPQR